MKAQFVNQHARDTIPGEGGNEDVGEEHHQQTRPGYGQFQQLRVGLQKTL
jgi:hypothetical protein